MKVPFNIPYVTGNEHDALQQAIISRRFCGGGGFGKQCELQLKSLLQAKDVLLTTSCTDALEMCATLLDIGLGDEVIAPSYTFVSSVNPFLMRGARIRFVDIEYPSLNASVEAIKYAITDKTKAIIMVHYGGGCDDVLAVRSLCDKNGITLIEDAAQSILGRFTGKCLGTFGHLGCLSFHETKNIHCGEGGAILVNDSKYLERAEIIREKGTNRSKFFKGQVDKYSWVDIGSSHIPSELCSAFLSQQLLVAEDITRMRRQIWAEYEKRCLEVGIPIMSFDRRVDHNAHIFGVFAPTELVRDRTIKKLRENGIQTAFHYVPLHSSIMGLKAGKFIGQDKYTSDLSERFLRLPIYPGIDVSVIDTIVIKLLEEFQKK